MKTIKIILISIFMLMPFNVFAYSDYIIPGGENIGIEVNSKGVFIVGFYKIDGSYNKNNLSIGDYILKVEDITINTIDELVKTIEEKENNGKVNMTILHNEKEKEIEFELIFHEGIYKTGLYVKDSISGIGTLTYIDPSTHIYGALGHEIIESNSSKRIEIRDGSIFKSEVSGIDRSVDGTPGTKNAKFYSGVTYGDVDKNTIHGIYGTYTEESAKELVEVGKPEELKLGYATIRTVTSENIIEEYEIKITKIDKNSDIKNIHFEITDKELLAKTGGIVQGMSGSPIFQDGKIFGAVTHVVVENVDKGYGVFITTMLEEGEK